MIRRSAALAAALLIGACTVVPKPAVAPPVPVTSVPPADALAAGLKPGPNFSSLPVTDEQALRALAAFRISCPALLRRQDRSGIAADWRPACEQAKTATDARAFFATTFETAELGDGRAFATGYYEPDIAAARTPEPGFAPIYRKPDDLIEQEVAVCPTGIDPAAPIADCPMRKRRGRLQDGVFLPYFDRTEIENGALSGRGLELAWAVDPVALFFLQIQGSGRLLFPDGNVMRIGYAGQNGHDYTGIGALLRQRKLLGPGQASMQGIVGWIKAHPEEGRALMRENRSYVFFQELTGPGPLGALGLPVTARGTVAADPRFTPLGAPVFLQLDSAEASGLWVAQDTGGAIKGANRFDTFWGPGEDVARIAGGLSARGRAWLLLPVGTLARIAHGEARDGAPAQR